uniref:GAF domain-containing protein n=1 Tax=Rhodococcus ruber TaxID=1830 RepID=UPI000A6D5EBC
PLSGVIGDLEQVVCSVAEASHMLMVVTDADGIVLWRAGSAKVRSRADSLGFSEGARWTESTVGTNAIGTALAEAAPVQLFSAEHFEQSSSSPSIPGTARPPRSTIPAPGSCSAWSTSAARR